jgi:DNA-binding IscR family transcriptional regulator
MNKNISEDIAFFNLLKGLIAPKLGNEALDYTISISDLANKMEIDIKIISSFLRKLQEDGLVGVLNGVNGNVSLHFEKTHDKLLEIISIDAVEEKISNMSDFIEKKISYFNINDTKEYIPKYALEVKNLMDEKGPNADISEIISRGIQEILGEVKNITLLNKTIFEIAKEADEDDLKRLEEIIYYKLNLPVEENPFYVTLFLTAVSYQIQYL